MSPLSRPAFLRSCHGAVTMASVSLVLWHATMATAIPASPNEGAPQQTTQIVGDAGGFFIAADVSYDALFGPWVKELENGDGPILSGEDVLLLETVTNTGSVTWTGWYEVVVSTTSIGIVIPGFLFRAGSLVLTRDANPLVEGVDYTVTPTVHTASADPGGNLGNWEAISISLTPSGEIAPGQTLTIQTSIFEVFLDANIWTPGEAAVIEQYPMVSPTRVPSVDGAGNLVLALLMAGFGGRALRRLRLELGRHTR